MDFCTNCVNEYAWRPTDNPFPKECKECEVVDGKPSNFKPKNKTNADRIRAWNDHELAETIANFVSEIDNGDVRYSDDPNDWLEWLEQPAEDK